MPYKDPEKRREYARGYYSSKDQKQKKRVYDHKRYTESADVYRESRSKHTHPHRYIYSGEWVCDFCGSTKDLVIHHINGDHKDNNVNNLKCLCASCHSRLHIEKRIRSATGQVEPVAINN